MGSLEPAAGLTCGSQRQSRGGLHEERREDQGAVVEQHVPLTHHRCALLDAIAVLVRSGDFAHLEVPLENLLDGRTAVFAGQRHEVGFQFVAEVAEPALRRVDPAMTFLLFNRHIAVVRRLVLVTLPQMQVRQPQTGSIVRVYGQNRVKEKPRSHPLTTVPRPLTRPAWLWKLSSLLS